jgi:hypothetical protein
MLPRKTLLAGLALAAAALGMNGPSASATETAHGYNNGDTGFVNLSVTQPIVAAGRSNADVLSMVGHCTFNQTVEPFSNNAVVQVIAKGGVTTNDPTTAHATGATVRCQIKDFATGTVLYDHTDGVVGPVVAWSTAYMAPVARLVVCTQVTALLSTGTVTSQTFPCQEPSLLPS